MIMLFWFFIVCMVGIALFVLLRPLRRKTPSRLVDANAAQIVIYQNRLREMEVEVANGVLSAADIEAARTELAQTLLQNTGSVNGAAEPTREIVQHDWRLIGIIATLLPVMALVLYLQLGTPDLINGGPASRHGELASDAAHTASIEAMVQRLAERLEQNPDDAEGWMMLVNSYMALDKYAEALRAVEHLYQVTGDQPDVLVRYADVLATVNGGNLSGKPSELIQKALTLEPANVIGLWLAGMAASQAGNTGAAIDYWQRLLPLLDGDEASQQEVRSLISKAREKTGMAAEVSGTAAAPGNGQADSAGAFTIKVSLSSELSKDARPDQALFVVAKAVNGPPMPVAVIRKTVADLPLEIKMDDSNAMMPSMKLSSFVLLEVSARIASGGNALPEPGEPVSAVAIVSPGQHDPVSLVIDRKTPQ